MYIHVHEIIPKTPTDISYHPIFIQQHATLLPSRTKSITPILTCESHLFQPWNFHMWSRENFNMQIRLKLCQIWRVEKFHTWKFQAWNFHT